MTEKQAILIVDDRKENLVILRRVLRDVDAEIIEATNGNQALAATLDHEFAMAILDVMMPGMDGFELATHLRGDEKTRTIPLVFVTASSADEQKMFEGYDVGGIDYILKPYNPQILLGKVRIFLELDLQKRELRQHRDHLEEIVATRTAELTRVNVQLQQDVIELERAERQLLAAHSSLELQLQGTVHVIQQMTETRDAYTSGHQKRVAELSVAIARRMELPEDSCVSLINMAALIHDIGKIAVPSEILSKPGRLSPVEFSLIQAHPQTGYDILKQAQLPYPVPETVLQHHERCDGSGYPSGLSGDEILPEASIVAVADVVEAMSSHRPYRAALGIDAALEEISAGRGTRYYSDVVDTCAAVFHENGFAFSG